MNISGLITQFRTYTADHEEPYLWTDAIIKTHLDEGELESCIRGRLIFDKTTTDICSIDISSGTGTYTVSDTILEITSAILTPTAGGDDITLEKISRAELDLAYPDWRTTDDPSYAIVFDDTSIEIIPAPAEDYTLAIEVYRSPVKTFSAGSSKPEIAIVHHKYIVRWAMHRAYLMNDSDANSAQLSLRYEKEFDDYYGIQQRSDTKKREGLDKLYHDDLFV